MRSLAIGIALAMVFGTATAEPKHHRRHPAKPKPVEEPAPAPAPEEPAPEVSVAEPPPSPPAPKLAMRPRAAVHAGSLADMDCSACHTEQGWKLAVTAGASGFDHDRTGFALRGAHVQTSCGGCHTGVAKPVTSCEGCHRDPHQGRHAQPCAECHTATAWADTTSLDQHRLTRMPLTGRHALIDCRDCHKRQAERVFSDTPADCYACHRTSYHDPQIHPTHDGSTGSAPFPRDCGLCHRTTAWSPAFTDPTTLSQTAMAMTGEHDTFFVLATGSHRGVECAACHPDSRRVKLVRCDGCHQDVALRTQHRSPVAMTATACLHCHPRGAAR